MPALHPDYSLLGFRVSYFLALPPLQVLQAISCYEPTWALSSQPDFDRGVEIWKGGNGIAASGYALTRGGYALTRGCAGARMVPMRRDMRGRPGGTR